METETVIYNGIEFIVDFSHQPEENPDRGPEAQYAGCPESIEISNITHSELDKSFTDAAEAFGIIEEFEDLIWDKIH